jgi:hypothetical protein
VTPPLGIRVFSATKSRERVVLGEVITEWIRAHPHYRLFGKVVLQSSDAEFHCLTIVVFFHYPASK